MLQGKKIHPRKHYSIILCLGKNVEYTFRVPFVTVKHTIIIASLGR